MRLAFADPRDRRDRIAHQVAVWDGELEHVTAHPALELLCGPGRDDKAMVDDHDLVGQLVGLIEVLGGQQQRGPAGDQRPDDVPHAEPRSRVKTCGRLVQEQDLGTSDQAGGQIQAALHAARVVLGVPIGGIGQVELLEEIGGPRPGVRLAQVVQPPDDLEILPAGELLLNGGRLPGQPDQAADRGCLPDDIASLDQCLALVRLQQGSEDAHGRCLARAVRPEDAEHRPAWHDKIDSAERVYVPERLRQALDKDRRPRTGL